LFELEEDLPPHPLMVPIAAMSSSTPSMARHARRREGIPKKKRRASAAPPPRRFQRFCLLSFPGKAIAVVALVDVTVMVDVAEVEPLANWTDGVFTAQVGRSVAPLGEVVKAQVSAIVPE